MVKTDFNFGVFTFRDLIFSITFDRPHSAHGGYEENMSAKDNGDAIENKGSSNTGRSVNILTNQMKETVFFSKFGSLGPNFDFFFIFLA